MEGDAQGYLVVRRPGGSEEEAFKTIADYLTPGANLAAGAINGEYSYVDGTATPGISFPERLDRDLQCADGGCCFGVRRVGVPRDRGGHGRQEDVPLAVHHRGPLQLRQGAVPAETLDHASPAQTSFQMLRLFP